MQHLFTILLLFFIFTNKEIFAQNINADSIETPLIFTNESGFVTKEDGMAFLLSNSLIDTTIRFSKLEEWDKINSTDTIGRYYQIENSDSYMMCLPYSLDFFRPIYLIMEVTSHGKLVKSEKFDFGNAHTWNTYYKDFSKMENFWVVFAQGGHAVHWYCKAYLFKKLLPQDSISYIRIGERHILHKSKYFRSRKEILKRYLPSTSMKIEGNELTLNYNLRNGKVKKDKDGYSNIFFKYSRRSKKVSIKYLYENEKWNTNDTKQLKKIERFMEVKLRQYII